MSALSDLKDKLATQDEKITVLTTATEGIRGDIQRIKDQLSQNEGGIDAAGVAELTAIVDGSNQKLSDAVQAVADLDAENEATPPTE